MIAPFMGRSARALRPPTPPTTEIYATSKICKQHPRTGQPYFTELAYGVFRAMRDLPDHETWTIWKIGPIAFAHRDLF